MTNGAGKIVELPDGKVVDFGDMKDADIEAYVKNYRAETPQSGGDVLAPQSTITGQPVSTSAESIQQGKDAITTAVRYGPTLAAGAMTGGVAVPALVAGGSEFLARRIERLGNDPLLSNLWDDFLGGSLAGALDAGSAGLFKGIGWATRAALKPRGMSPKAKVTQDVLSRFAPDADTPYTLTLGRMNAEERSFVNWLESIPRAALWGRGKMRAADLRNTRKITELIESYIEQRATNATGDEFSMFLRRTLGDIDNIGEAFDPVETLGKYYYKQFDKIAAANPQVTIDATPLMKYFQSQGGRSQVKEILDTATSLEQVPGLRKGVQETTAEIEQGRLNRSQWATMSLQDADNFMKTLNEGYEKLTNAEKNVVDHIRGKIQPQFDAQLKTLPDALEFYSAAKGFHGVKRKKMYNDTIKAIRTSLKKNPQEVIKLFTVNAGRANRLKSLKEALGFSAAIEGGKDVFEKKFHQEILKPIRYHLVGSAIDKTTGELSADALLTNIKKYSQFDDNFLKEVYGGQKQVDYMREMAVALKEAGQKATDQIFIQLVQASKVAAVAGGAMYAFSDDPKTIGIGTAVGVLVAPRLMAEVFANPKMTRAVIDGLKEGSKSAKFGRMLRKLTTQWLASQKDPASALTPENFNYYTSVPDAIPDTMGRPAPYDQPTQPGELPFPLTP